MDARGDLDLVMCRKMKNKDSSQERRSFMNLARRPRHVARRRLFTNPVREQYELSAEILRLKGELREQYNKAKSLSEFEETMRRKFNRAKSKSKKRGKLVAKSVHYAKELQRENYEIFTDLKKRNALDLLGSKKKEEKRSEKTLDRLESLVLSD